jgi:hypothetical protein
LLYSLKEKKPARRAQFVWFTLQRFGAIFCFRDFFSTSKGVR